MKRAGGQPCSITRHTQAYDFHINSGANMNTEEHILTYAKNFVNGLRIGRASMPAMPVHEWMMFMTLVREQMQQQEITIH